MFDLNPLNNPDALWQHLIMLAGAIIIGYMIGHLDSKTKKEALEVKLNKISNELEICQTQTTSSPIAKSVNTSPSLAIQPSDDFKIIEGIGPAIEQLLYSNGIYTYTHLSQTQPNLLVNILQKSGNNFQMHDPRTWPQQAKLAEAKMWDALKELQKELNGGRSEN